MCMDFNQQKNFEAQILPSSEEEEVEEIPGNDQSQ